MFQDDAWVAQYKVNDAPFTQAQTDASEKVSAQLGDTATNAQTVTETASSAQADSNTSSVTNSNDSNKVGVDTFKTVHLQ